MSHFAVIVVGPDVDKQLAPFSENLVVPEYREFPDDNKVKALMRHYGVETLTDLVPHLKDYYGREGGLTDDGRLYTLSTYNPQAKWDWYSIGGRWTGYFKASEGARGAPGLMTEEASGPHFDVVRKGGVDFASMRMDRGVKAGAEWDAVHAIFDAHGGPPPAFATLVAKYRNGPDLTWEQVRAKHGDNIDAARADFNGPTDAAWREYHELAVCRALEKAKLMPWNHDVVELFCVPRADVVRDAEDSAVVPFAMLVNGEWLERGKMLMFGQSIGEMPQKEWNQKVWSILLALPDDTLLTAVDCHI